MKKNLFYYFIILLFCTLGIFALAFSTSEFDVHEFDFTEEIIFKETIKESTSAKATADKEEDLIITNTLPETVEKEEQEMEEQEEKESVGELIFIDNVPFTPQAPFAEWSDPRQQDGCEEASVLMAMKWVRGEDLTLYQAKEEIILMSRWQENKYNNYIDTSAQDTYQWLIKEYYQYDEARVEYDIQTTDIIKELTLGNVVIIPANGRALGNPNFTPPGPERHMVLVHGFDYATNEFITNDPGTRNGEEYRYSSDTLFSAIMDYPTGNRLPITEIKKAMIVVSK